MRGTAAELDDDPTLAAKSRSNRASFAVAIYWLAQSSYMTFVLDDYPSWSPQPPLALAMVVVHFALEMMHRVGRGAALRRHTSYLPAVLDVPLLGMALTMSVQHPRIGSDGPKAALMLMAVYALLILLSALSLEPRAVGATAAAAVAFQLGVFGAAGAFAPSSVGIALFVLVGCGFAAGYVAGIVKKLEEAKEASPPSGDEAPRSDASSPGFGSGPPPKPASSVRGAVVTEVLDAAEPLDAPWPTPQTHPLTDAQVSSRAASPTPFATEGTMITPKVRLLRLLGEGGMGSVWRAHHLGLECDVAVKLIASHIAQHPAAAARFAREARLAAKIRDPHVVQIYDYGITEAGLPYMVMELLDGSSLGEYVASRGPLPPAEVADIIAQAAAALSAAHAQGVVHRDIKPDNLFLVSAEEFRVKVLDFGIAKQADTAVASMTQTGTLLGTPHYMSPEQVQSSRDTDAQADLWALAVTAYHALTGQLPFQGETIGAVSIAIASSDYLPPSQLLEQLSPELDRWFARAFHRDKQQRFAHAKELSATLSQAC